MKKSMLFLLVVCTFHSCERVKNKEMYNEVTTLSSLKKAEVTSYENVYENVSIAEVKGNDEANGKDIAEVKQDVNHIPTVANQPQHTNTSVLKKKIIKDGRMGLLVNDIQKSKHEIDSLLKVLGGYYANENLSNSENDSGFELTIRIPVINFDKFVYSAERGKDKVLYKEIEARDVTEQFVDLESRLNSKRNSLDRYNEILKKANSVKDIIQIEESIRVLQEEIESTEGKLRYLNDCVNYSTLHLTLSTEKNFTFKPQKRHNFWEKFKESIVGGWFELIDFVLGIFSMWPFWLIVIGLYFLIRRGIKKFRKSREEKNTQKII